MYSWLVPLKIVSNVSRFKLAHNLNRVLTDLNRGLNSLNSISDFEITSCSKNLPLSYKAIMFGELSRCMWDYFMLYHYKQY